MRGTRTNELSQRSELCSCSRFPDVSACCVALSRGPGTGTVGWSVLRLNFPPHGTLPSNPRHTYTLTAFILPLFPSCWLYRNMADSFYHTGNMRGIFSHPNAEGVAVWKNRKKLCIGILYGPGSFHVFRINIHEYIRCLENCLANQVILGNWCVRTFADSECSFLFLFFLNIYFLYVGLCNEMTLWKILFIHFVALPAGKSRFRL